VSIEAFTQAWADAWAAELNASPSYRAAAARWDGAVALVMEDAGDRAGRAVLLDLWHGGCRSAVAMDAGADAPALADAAFVFSGALAGWRQVFAEGVSPVIALLNGRIRLARGRLAALLPYAGAAKELLELAGRVVTSFPEG
jgi:putative sterol carrier protein